MNKRIMKKKFNKWTAHHDDQTVDLGSMISCAADAKGIQQTKPKFDKYGRVEYFYYTREYVKFAQSRNVMRAVKSYAKKYVYHTGRCDNIKAMYRCMCEEIHADREYRKRIAEQIREEDVRNATADWEQQERTQQAFTAEWFRDAGCPDMEHATEMFVDLYNDINS